MEKPSIRAALTALEILNTQEDSSAYAIGLSTLNVPAQLTGDLPANDSDGSNAQTAWSAGLVGDYGPTESLSEFGDSFVFQNVATIEVYEINAATTTHASGMNLFDGAADNASSVHTIAHGSGTSSVLDLTFADAAPTVNHLSAVALAATESFSIGDSGLAMMCGCAACVAARNEDNSSQQDNNFLATASQFDDQLMVADGIAGADGMVSAAAPGYAINALLAGSKWGSFTLGAPATVTYSFLTSIPSYYGFTDPTFQTMNAAQKQAALDAFAMYSQVANITFTQVAPGTGSINLGVAFLGTNVGGGAWYPRNGYAGNNDNSTDGDVWITNHSTYVNPTAGSWAYQTFIHEIGHAIGMKHPGNYNAGGGGTPGPYLPTGEDNHKYTVMSYYSQPGYSGIAEPITPQIYDIATIQYLYGANYSTRSGNDTYTFTTSPQIKTIWDGGGTDTFDASNQASAVSIDLHDGAFSSIAGSSNIAIAYGAIIENAIGSNYNDTLTASNAGSTITGGRGNDTIVGGTGTDTVVYSGARSSYTAATNGNGGVVITDTRGGAFDGVDTVYGIEFVRFADSTFALSSLLGPDLSAYVTLNATTFAPGASATISSYVINYGGTASAGSTTAYYLSTDASITTSDTLLTTKTSPGLAPLGTTGFFDLQTFNISLPGNLTPGTYYVGGIADYNAQVAEGNESNNTDHIATLTVTAPVAPDLSAYVSLSNATVAPGGSTTISSYVINYGTGSSAGSTTAYYLSTDANITTGDTLLTTKVSPGLTALGTAGFFDLQTFSVALPGNLTPGTYYVGGIADYNAQVAESNENNNTDHIATLTVTPPASPDLSAYVSLSNSTLAPGGSTTISSYVINYGAGSSAGSTTAYYLSTDANITTGDTLLTTTVSPGLTALGAAGFFDFQTFSVALPGNLAPGTYYVGGIADYNAQVAESNETNNTDHIATLTVTAPPAPDLSAYVTLSNASVMAGGSTTVSSYVINYGAGSSAASTTAYYLSTDANITTGDTLLTTKASPGLTALGTTGFYDFQTFSVSLPGNLAPGTYYIGGIADYNAQVTESNETNNTDHVAVLTVPSAAPIGDLMPDHHDWWVL